MDTSKFYIITPYSNHLRWESRRRLYWEFKELMRKAGMEDNLITVELAFGDRAYEVTTGSNLRHVQLRTYDELWHKENCINRALERLMEFDPEFQYVGWYDADISTADPQAWVEETVHQLQHFMVVQPWHTCVDLGPNEEVLQVHKSFCYQYQQGKPFGTQYEFWHPGYAWAARREAMEGVGQLLDRAILGAGDHHMALAMVGRGAHSVPGKINENYRLMVERWQERAVQHIRHDIGYVDALLFHHWHGKKKDRRYVERWDILERHDYNPYSDVGYDMQGILEWRTHDWRLVNDVRRYFRARNEDSIDLE